MLCAYEWKSQLSDEFPIIISLLGGTGTGKSTIFNSIAGKVISNVATIRPATMSPVILVDKKYENQISNYDLFSSRENNEVGEIVTDTPHPQIIIIDTPDFDSVQTANRDIAEHFFILSDVLIFVNSQEKYGDFAVQNMVEAAKSWGKQIVFILNKVDSNDVLAHFEQSLDQDKTDYRVISVPRIKSVDSIIPDFNKIVDVTQLFQPSELKSGEIKRRELTNLRTAASDSLMSFYDLLDFEYNRVEKIQTEIGRIETSISHEMDHKLDEVMDTSLEVKIKERLQNLLRKYDILFVPRMFVRNAIIELTKQVSGMFGGNITRESKTVTKEEVMTEDLLETKSSANLIPLIEGVSKLNSQVADYLAHSEDLRDIRQISSSDVARFDAKTIHEKYEALFPGIEHLLEEEFKKFREGLSAYDELKLYGSYTIWALLLITAEIVVGGGITLLDAVLNTVIMPFIPKWLLSLKILDLLRQIGENVNKKHRKAMNEILQEQSHEYYKLLNSLLPEKDSLDSKIKILLSDSRT